MHKEAISLEQGDPETGMVRDDLVKAVQMVQANPSASSAFGYGPDRGSPELIEWLTGYLSNLHGRPVLEQNLLIVAGASQGVQLLASCLGPEAANVFVESPTFQPAVKHFQDLRLPIVDVPMRSTGGLDITALRDPAGSNPASPKSKLPKYRSILYTIPTFHNPTGGTLSHNDRLGLLDWAEETGSLIIEDAVYQEIYFDGVKPPPSLFSLDSSDRVCNVGSFSKILSPGLRLGWIVAPADVIDQCLQSGTLLMGGGASNLSAHIVAAYVANFDWPDHLATARGIYGHRRDAMDDALTSKLGNRAQWVRPGGGFFHWVAIDGADQNEIVMEAAKRDLLLAPSTNFTRQEHPETYVRLPFSATNEGQIRAAIDILSSII